jgi:hypothetical protein
MSGILWRVIIAVIVVVILFALLGPVLRIFGVAETGDLMTILRIAIGGLALLYVISGEGWIGRA